MKVLRIVTVAFAAAMVFAPTALAERVKPNIHFFSGPQSDAHWTPQDSADANRMSIELDVGPLVSGGYAGFELNHVEGTPPPAREPRFFHREDREGPSGGSPRLVIVFPTGNIQLRPEQWTTSWQFVGEGDGDGNWDVTGGSCGFRYDVTYEEALACHEDALVQAVFMVSDSNWLYPTGYLNWVDRLQYNGFEYSHASDNNNRPADAGPPLSVLGG
ncbi:MAG: hypothetical protein M3389_01605 [Actinomycetota bacterium]|nr:hypothetical protein [Actinomycetota bacterium]